MSLILSLSTANEELMKFNCNRFQQGWMLEFKVPRQTLRKGPQNIATTKDRCRTIGG